MMRRHAASLTLIPACSANGLPKSTRLMIWRGRFSSGFRPAAIRPVHGGVSVRARMTRLCAGG